MAAAVTGGSGVRGHPGIGTERYGWWAGSGVAWGYGTALCAVRGEGRPHSNRTHRGASGRGYRPLEPSITSFFIIKKPESSLPTWVPPTEHRSWCSDPTVRPRREGRARIRDDRRSRCLSSEEATRLWCCVAASPGYRSPGRRGAAEPSTWNRIDGSWGGLFVCLFVCV